jgi:hypothetical protein
VAVLVVAATCQCQGDCSFKNPSSKVFVNLSRVISYGVCPCTGRMLRDYHGGTGSPTYGSYGGQTSSGYSSYGQDQPAAYGDEPVSSMSV